MGKKNKLKKLIDAVDCIIENDEFLLSRRMGLSKSAEPLKLNPENIHNGDTKYLDSAYGGWYYIPQSGLFEIPQFKNKN